MENYIGKICPFCKTEITEADAVKVCPACDIPHHEGCWNENHGCTTFGCSQQNSVTQQVTPEPQPTAPTSICSNCGAPLGDGQAFCPQCGTPKAAAPKPNLCRNCGAPLGDGQAFCPSCGYRAAAVVDTSSNSAIDQFNNSINQQKKKSKSLPIVIAAVLGIVVLIGIVGGTLSKEKQAEDDRKQTQAAVDDYLEDAEAFYTAILASGSTMEDIGNEMKTSWSAYVNSKYYNGKRYYSVDSAIAAAQLYVYSDITAVKNANSNIETLYKQLLTVPDTSNQQLQEIKDTVKETYQAYQDMYDCVISPSGNYNSWTSEFKTTDSELADAIGDLGMLLE